MKDLPVGVSRNGGTKKGYRLHRSVAGKNYLFSSFQNLDHALRVNECIDVIVADLREALDKEGTFSVNDIQKLIVENSLSDMEEITRLINDSNRHINRKFLDLMEQNARLHDRLENQSLRNAIVQSRLDALEEQPKSFWQRITGR